MENVEVLIQAWDEAHWEFTLVFEGLSDADLWRRADPRLLSVGELAGHVYFHEATLAGRGAIESPLVDERFHYYVDHVNQPVQLELGVAQVLAEMERVHVAARDAVRAVADMDALVPWRTDWTWMQCLRYKVFHTAYHCGQAFSVRHLMGHTTTDN